MLPDGSRIICVTTVAHNLLGWICVTTTDPAQPITTAGEELHRLDHGLSEVLKARRRRALKRPLTPASDEHPHTRRHLLYCGA